MLENKRREKLSDKSSANQKDKLNDTQLSFGDAPLEASEDVAVYSVNEINRMIKTTLEGKFPVVWVKGEISNFKPHYSGHWYFNLKDEKSQISAVMFRGYNQQSKLTPEDGMEVIVRGRVTVYEPRGSYQLMCEVIEPVGLGTLQKAFEKLKEKLSAEGLFSLERKKTIPQFPSRVAIVTSPTGAAIRDMLNVLTRRFRGIEITVIPTPVQGATAAKEIARAIQMANKVQPPYDVLIVGRGGGSIEDLWSFNEEIVARALAESKIPTISAVGHEIDVTISDFVADLRAPTPSAAAELVVANAVEICARVEKMKRSMISFMRSNIENKKIQMTRLARHLIDPKRRLEDSRKRCMELLGRLNRLLKQSLERSAQDLDLLTRRLEDEIKTRLTDQKQYLLRVMGLLGSLNPLAVVDRGYAIVTKNNEVIKESSQIAVGDSVDIRLAQGEFSAEIKNIKR